MTEIYLGVPCKHGHSGERYVSNKVCVECNRIAGKKHREKYPEKYRHYNRVYHKKPTYQARMEKIRQERKNAHPGEITFMGIPCKHGHSGERYVSNKVCVECERSRKWKLIRAKQAEARLRKANSLTNKYIGKPCKHGHMSGVRYISTGFCVECGKLKTKENIEYSLLYQKARRRRLKDDPEYKRKNLERSRKWYSKHRLDPDLINSNAKRSTHHAAIIRNTIGLLYYEGYV